MQIKKEKTEAQKKGEISMKQFLLLALLMLLALPAFSQEEDPNNMVIASVRYDEGILVSGGYAPNIAGGLWAMFYADFGNYESVNTELAYFIPFSENLYIGPVAGPNADWYNLETDSITGTFDYSNVINYVAGAAGGMVFVKASDHWGVTAYAKRKFALESGNLYPDGWIYSLGFSYSF